MHTNNHIPTRFDGDNTVFKKLFRKKLLLKQNNPQHKAIRPLLVVLPGTMRGVIGGGQVSALEAHGLSEVFDNALGISTGAPIISYFLSKQTKLGTSIYYDELPKHNFIDFKRILSKKDIANIDMLCDIFYGKIAHKKLDTKQLLANRTKASVLSAEYTTASPLHLPLTSHHTIIEHIRASLAIPLAYKNITINNTQCIDGIAAMHALPQIIEGYNPTDVVILSNMHTPPRVRKLRNLLHTLILSPLPKALRQNLIQSDSHLNTYFKSLSQNTQYRSTVVWGEPVGTYEMRPHILKKAAKQSFVRMHALLKKYKKV